MVLAFGWDYARGQQTSSNGWRLADGTEANEESVVAILAEHLVAEYNLLGNVKKTTPYLEQMKALPQRLAGASLPGIHFGALLERAYEKSEISAEDHRSFSLLDLSNCDFEAADFTRLYITKSSFAGSNFYNAHCDNSTWDYVDASNAMFAVCRFPHTSRYKCNFSDSDFSSCQFIDASLDHCNACGADFSDATFTRAKITDTDLANADFKRAKIVHSEIVGSDISGAIFERAYLVETLWESRGKPIAASFAAARNLDTLHFETSPAGLVTLRNALQEVGLRDSERAVNYALQRDRIDHIWNDTVASASRKAYVDRWGTVFEKGQPRKTNWFGFVEVAFNKLLFDWPCMYGYTPGRALRLVVYLSVLCMLPYAITILHPVRKRTWLAAGGIWALPLEKRVVATPSAPKRLQVKLTTNSWFKGLVRALKLGLFFSVITAFSVGYKDLDVGRWIERIKREETTLRATGWVRTISGVQALVSFYLIVLWVLTYFGRPFE